jgi:hypothetical protein
LHTAAAGIGAPACCAGKAFGVEKRFRTDAARVYFAHACSPPSTDLSRHLVAWRAHDSIGG